MRIKNPTNNILTWYQQFKWVILSDITGHGGINMIVGQFGHHCGVYSIS